MVDGSTSSRWRSPVCAQPAPNRSTSPCGSTITWRRRFPFDSEHSATFNDDRQDFGGQVVEFKTHLGRRRSTPGRRAPAHLRRTAPRYEGPKAFTRPKNPAAREFKPPPNATPERLAQLRKTFDDTQAELAKIR